MNYEISRKLEDENIIRIHRTHTDFFASNINSKDFSICLLNCELIQTIPVKIIKCDDIKIHLKLTVKPKGFREISFECFVEENMVNFDKIWIHEGRVLVKEQKPWQTKEPKELPENVKIVDGLLQYQMTFK